MLSIAFLGRGGQGIVFAAEVVAEALFEQGLYVAQLQSYGAEVRGGSVLAYVVADSSPIENPFIEGFSVALVLHDAGAKRWTKHLENTRVVIVDRDLVAYRGPNTIEVPIARECSAHSLAGSENVVGIGLLAAANLVDRAVLENVLKKKPNAERNLRALELGIDLCRRLGIENALRGLASV